jgi:hypothetical protein
MDDVTLSRRPENHSTLLVELLCSIQVQLFPLQRAPQPFARNIAQRPVLPRISHCKKNGSVALHENILRHICLRSRRPQHWQAVHTAHPRRTLRRRNIAFLFRCLGATPVAFHCRAARIRRHKVSATGKRKQHRALVESGAAMPPAIHAIRMRRRYVGVIKTQPGSRIKLRGRCKHAVPATGNCELLATNAGSQRTPTHAASTSPCGGPARHHLPIR